MFYNQSKFVKSYIDSIDRANRIKYTFGLYPYNGRAVNIFFHFLKAKRSDPSTLCNNGYLPLPVTKRDSLNILKQYAKSIQKEQAVIELDEGKLDVVKQIASIAQKHNIQLIFFRSPTFRYDTARNGSSSDVFRAQFDEPFIDFMYDSIPILDQASYWKDMSHVNKKGARVQTQVLIAKLNELGIEL